MKFVQSNFSSFALALAVLSPAIVSTPVQAVPVVWGVNGHSYEVFRSGGISWDAANAAATAAGGHLVTVLDAAEDSFVLSLIQTAQLTEVWGGGYQSAPGTSANADWNWVTGEAWGFTNWSAGEPNDYYGAGSEQHLGLNWSGFWNDEGALGNVSGYVVEWSRSTSVPDGGTTAILLGACMLGVVAWRRK